MPAKRSSKKRAKAAKAAFDPATVARATLGPAPSMPSMIAEVVDTLVVALADVAERDAAFKSIATISRKQFDAYKAAGFTEDQALYLVGAAMERSASTVTAVTKVVR